MKMFKLCFIRVISLALLVTKGFFNDYFAQPEGQTTWRNYLKLESAIKMTGDCEATLEIKASLVKDWHIFSINHDPDKADFIGAPTVFNINKSPKYEVVGKTTESKNPKRHVDDLGIQLYHEGVVVFSRKIKALTQEPFDVIGDLEFQICDENGCLFPPAQEFTFRITPSGNCGSNANDSIAREEINISSGGEEVQNDRILKKVVFDKGEWSTEKKTLYTIFILGFLGGFLALLTPCVFPLIPMTVSFFTKQTKTRREGILKALMYGLAIVLIYVLLGAILSQFMSGFGLNDLASNIWMNLIFFAIFIIFAFSFLGAFEIRMPSGLVNKADRQADKGGLIGVFFMAFTLVLVSFSCTGPIVGSLLIESISTGNIMSPAIGMFGFGLALALPFTLFAIFPGWLSSLPSSGGWLNSVKVVLGLLELAIALKFLSTIDLTYKWNILTREVFVAVWVVVFGIIGFYLLGKIRFAHDDKVEKLSVTRFMFAITSLVFAVYLLPGMWGAPLHFIEGVAPPRHHSEDGFEFIKGNGESPIIGDAEFTKLFRAYEKDMHVIQDGSIRVFHDTTSGFEFAQKLNRPVLLDFTGYSCENCRKTESKIWLDKTVKPLLLKEFVIVSLYVDDKDPLPEDEQYYSEESNGKIKTVGNKWADYQIKKYKQISQPLYVIVDPVDGADLTAPRGYDSSVEGYRAYLEKGIKRFKERRK
jgi:thiol:disulfide interchange protein DsbD